MKIAVVGTGYVGLVAGACFADLGNEVVCVDVDAEKIGGLQLGIIPIYEPGLEELVKRNMAEERLSFTVNLPGAVANAEVVFIAVGTPPKADGSADLSHVLACARAIGQSLTRFTVVATKSTVPVGTADMVRDAIASVAHNPFTVVSNPEFMKEGTAVQDFLSPDRIVIGADNARARGVMQDLYEPFMRKSNRILYMDIRSAELTKYAANAMLATRISFMNDIAHLCERVGADVEAVRHGVGADSRIGHSFLYPGVGYGGSCFPKDVRALIATAEAAGMDYFDLLHAVEATNERQKRCLFTKALKHFGSLTGRTFAVWGLAFKPKTDDMREAPAVTLIEELLANGARVKVFDPVAMDAARERFEDRVTYSDSPYAALDEADALFVMTEWNEFRHPDLMRMRGLMNCPVIFDGRNVFEPAAMRARSFTYYGIGR